MLIPVLTLATALSLSLGTDAGAMSEVSASAVNQAASATRPQFSLGAGDALGARIRVNDIVLARRLDAERIQFATVPDRD